MEKLLSTYNPEDVCAKEFCRKYRRKTAKRYILGCNVFSINIANQIDVVAFVDDFSSDKEFFNKPIIKSSQLPQNAMVVIAVLGRPFIASNSIENGIAKLDYFSFETYSGLDFSKAWFNRSFQDDAIKNYEKYNKIYNLLSDDISKEQFSKIYRFRAAYALSQLEGFIDTQRQQYFEDFLTFSDSECFLDVGGFDGRTTEKFIEVCGEFNQIHIFEPDKKNCKLISALFKETPGIYIHNYGVSNASKLLKFNSDGVSSKFCSEGDSLVGVKRIDDVISCPVSFIKMDVEGSELTAIEGAENTIKLYSPKLAISVYHRASDMWQIPEKILAINKNYRLYFRHYMEGISESVMFFIPDGS